MNNILGSNRDQIELFVGDVWENLKNLSADQINNLDLDAIQVFVKQKESEYKKEYKEFRECYDDWAKNISTMEAHQKKQIVMNKFIDIEKKYRLYIKYGNSWNEVPEDFKDNFILASDKFDKQYDRIKKRVLEKQDVDALRKSKMRQMDALWVALCTRRTTKDNNPQYREGYEARTIEDILQEVDWNIDKYVVTSINSMANPKWLKLTYIQWFVNLKYLLAAAKKNKNREDVSMIQNTINHLLESIQKLDTTKKPLDGGAKELLIAIK